MTLMSYQTQAAPELKQPELLAASKLVSTMVRCCVWAFMQFTGALSKAAQKREELLRRVTSGAVRSNRAQRASQRRVSRSIQVMVGLLSKLISRGTCEQVFRQKSECLQLFLDSSFAPESNAEL